VYNHSICQSEASQSKFYVHPWKCLYVQYVRIVCYPAHINVTVDFLPHPLQNFRCDGLHRTIDFVPEILERLGQWGGI
jgi:hypothetical protein